jgi:hypothetical protein
MGLFFYKCFLKQAVSQYVWIMIYQFFFAILLSYTALNLNVYKEETC